MLGLVLFGLWVTLFIVVVLLLVVMLFQICVIKLLPRESTVLGSCESMEAGAVGMNHLSRTQLKTACKLGNAHQTEMTSKHIKSICLIGTVSICVQSTV